VPGFSLDDHLVSLQRPASWEAEPYRTLRHAVERLRGEGGGAALAISSAAPGDGKTTTALNLAAALAERPRSQVLVIDGDLRRARVAAQVGARAGELGPGLCGAVAESRLTLAEVTRSFSHLPFSIVPAGRCDGTPYAILESPKLGRLIEEARRRYTFVLVDTPPYLPFTDCRVLSRWVDGFLLVVAAHRTPRRLLLETLEAAAPAGILGLVFNEDDGPIWNSSGYYQRYQQPLARLPPSAPPASAAGLASLYPLPPEG
jgi:capsular exopolysaccharide synthesis family protein